MDMFVTPAFAQAAGGAAGAAGGLISFVPIILIFGIMYVLMIRPQQKKVKRPQGDGRVRSAAATRSSPPAG